MEDEERLADPEETPQEQELERTLRPPRSLAAFVGQPVLREQTHRSSSRRLSHAENHLTMFCWQDHLGWARPPLPTSSRRK